MTVAASPPDLHPADLARDQGGRLLTAAEVAERWQLPVAAIYRLVRENKIPHVRLGERRVRFAAKQIEAFEQAGGTPTQGRVRHAR